jgi:hypothetical protein
MEEGKMSDAVESGGADSTAGDRDMPAWVVLAVVVALFVIAVVIGRRRREAPLSEQAATGE